MPLIDFEAQVQAISNFTVKDQRLRVFELRSLDPTIKMRSISLPVEEAEGVRFGTVLRITVEVV